LERRHPELFLEREKQNSVPSGRLQAALKHPQGADEIKVRKEKQEENEHSRAPV
jgi:hypothetical protein